MSAITQDWTMSPSEVRVLLRPDVLKKYQSNPPDWFTGMFSVEQRLQILNILKTAGEVQNQGEKPVSDYINRQEVWLKEALIVILEEEIKKGRPGEVIQSSMS